MKNDEFSNLTNSNQRTISFISNAGHALFFSALFILNNPFVFLDTEVRFGLFLSILAAGVFFIYISENKKRNINHILWISILIFYGIATIRINTVGSAFGLGSASERTQAIVTIYSITMSSLIAERINIDKMNRSILFVSAVCFLPILIYSRDLFDYYQKDSFRIGVLTYDSYQAASQIIGFFVISLISFAFSQKRSLLLYFVTLVLVVVAFYAVTLSPARGEAIALAAAILILAVSRSKLGYLALFIVGVLATSDSFFETTLGSRLSGVASGDFGERDYLFKLAINQFFGDFYTILIGTGFNGFQYFNNLPLELYPHNFLLEGMISGGFFLFIILAYVYVTPIINLFMTKHRTSNQNLALAMMVFLVMINLKSGTLVSFWGMGCYTAVFLTFSFHTRNKFKNS